MTSASLSWGLGVASVNSGPALVWLPLLRTPLPCRQAVGSPGRKPLLHSDRTSENQTVESLCEGTEVRVKAPQHAGGTAGHG